MNHFTPLRRIWSSTRLGRSSKRSLCSTTATRSSPRGSVSLGSMWVRSYFTSHSHADQHEPAGHLASAQGPRLEELGRGCAFLGEA